jgi:hypothetical protein
VNGLHFLELNVVKICVQCISFLDREKEERKPVINHVLKLGKLEKILQFSLNEEQ